MQAIKTKYLPATNTKGSRIKASCGEGSIIIPSNYSLQGIELDRFAAFALIDKLGWEVTELHTGWLEDYYVHIPVFKKREETDLPEFLKKQA